ncbi:PadR family transcriptional regulator [Fervidicoccus fontis]|uniref:PadR family transcriptional regulator n=1 Tax=Fervidicoccus fontis TaxID=683846 RepID=A0A7C2ZVW4_9CREN|nr:helix-turn-helix transcriptional regulator [Fervidicoccus fontis]HEW63479.1 PadR family transcriptional regulator [Fervidicoccus fontis]
MEKESKSRAFERLKKKIENEVLWIYVSCVLIKKGALSINEIKKEINDLFGIKVNTLYLYSIIYRMEEEGLIVKVEGDPKSTYTITPEGELTYKKALVFLEEKLLQLKKLF